MSSGKTHLVVGAITGLSIALIDNEKHGLIHNPVVAPALGAFFGKLPDVIEPAFHPNHRQFFHSTLTFSAIGLGTYKAYQWEAETGFEKILRGVMLIAGCSYLSHLVCDSTTPKGLPLIGKL